MKVLVTGGRDYADWDTLQRVLASFPITSLAHGGASGADTMAGQWAGMNGVPNQAYPAAWRLHGKAAGVIRNKQMLDEFQPDLVVAFPGGYGTAHMVRIAENAGVPVVKIEAEQ